MVTAVHTGVQATLLQIPVGLDADQGVAGVETFASRTSAYLAGWRSRGESWMRMRSQPRATPSRGPWWPPKEEDLGRVGNDCNLGGGGGGKDRSRSRSRRRWLQVGIKQKSETGHSDEI